MLKYCTNHLQQLLVREDTEKTSCLMYFKVAEAQSIGCRCSSCTLLHITSHLQAQRPTHLLKGMWRVPKAGNPFYKALYLSPSPSVSHVP